MNKINMIALFAFWLVLCYNYGPYLFASLKKILDMSQQNRRKSLFWVLSWVFSFSSAMALAKMLKQNNPNIPIHILVLARSFFAFTMVLPLAVRQGFKGTVTVKRKKAYCFTNAYFLYNYLLYLLCIPKFCLLQPQQVLDLVDHFFL